MPALAWFLSYFSDRQLKSDARSQARLKHKTFRKACKLRQNPRLAWAPRSCSGAISWHRPPGPARAKLILKQSLRLRHPRAPDTLTHQKRACENTKSCGSGYIRSGGSCGLWPRDDLAAVYRFSHQCDKTWSSRIPRQYPQSYAG